MKVTSRIPLPTTPPKVFLIELNEAEAAWITTTWYGNTTLNATGYTAIMVSLANGLKAEGA